MNITKDERQVDCLASFLPQKNMYNEEVYRISTVGMRSAAEEASDSRDFVKRFEERLQNIVITIGIPPHIKGFSYLKDAVRAVFVNPKLIDQMTKGLYPEVADRNDTSASKVERAIRHAIEVGWQRGKIENLNSILGARVVAKSDKPTNGELVALIAGKMSLEFYV